VVSLTQSPGRVSRDNFFLNAPQRHRPTNRATTLARFSPPLLARTTPPSLKWATARLLFRTEKRTASPSLTTCAACCQLSNRAAPITQRIGRGLRYVIRPLADRTGIGRGNIAREHRCAQDATVRLIDCDSFQIVTRTHKFLCEVGVETFAPPELQGKPFKGLVRTDNHDNFLLAVLIFLMLFMGRHPFAGRYLGRGDMPIPTAIRECGFAYGTRRATVQMEKPPGTPALSIVGDDIAFLFERAFAPEMISGGRPNPRDWVESLGRLEKELKQCSANPSHWHRKEQSCPWCPMEGATGVALFPLVAPVAGAVFNMEALWRQIESIRHPGPPPEIPTPAVQASQAARRVGAANHTRKIAASIVGGIMIAASVLVATRHRSLRAVRRRHRGFLRIVEFAR
jgi:hypothetical protein